MRASLEPPDGAPAVEGQGGAADRLDRAAGVPPQAKVSGENAAPGAILGRADPDVGAGDPDRARAPDVRVPPAEGDLQRDHVLEEALGALAQLAAAGRVPGERVGARDAGPGGRQLGMKPRKNAGTYSMTHSARSRSCSGRQDLNQGTSPRETSSSLDARIAWQTSPSSPGLSTPYAIPDGAPKDAESGCSSSR